MNIQTIKSQLKKLRLPTASRELEEVIHQQKQAISLNWLSDLLSREMDARKENAMKARIKNAGFPSMPSLEAFDFSFNPEINEAKINELKTLDFIKQNQIALFLGPPGTGKTHIALSLGLMAAQQGHRVYCTSSKKLSRQITMAKLKNNLDSLFKKILTSPLWIFDDWGVVSMDREIAEEVFDLLDRRKQNSAMILTSNRAVEEWGEVFPDNILANATIDRIFEQAEIILFKGKSYRLKEKIKIQEFDNMTKNI